MSHASNPKEVAVSFFDRLSNGMYAEALDLLDDRGTWWNVAPRTAVPMPTFKESSIKIMSLLPMKFRLHNMISEGNTVLLELESISPKPDGGTYNNRYCYVIETCGDRILHVREYPDTKYAAEILPTEAWQFEQESWAKHHGPRYFYSDAPQDSGDN